MGMTYEGLPYHQWISQLKGRKAMKSKRYIVTIEIEGPGPLKAVVDYFKDACRGWNDGHRAVQVQGNAIKPEGKKARKP